MNHIDYTLIRSGRRTLSLEITKELDILVRAPNKLSIREIDGFVQKHSGWIAAHQERIRINRVKFPEPDAAEAALLKKRAEQEIPMRVAQYARLMGLTPSSIKITSAQKRFGSCSGKNGICFSWRLMRCPDAAIDYVVVHELAHIAHKNHGKQFYGCIAAILPDYKERRALLR